MAIVGALPVQLANGTLADATQVMSDFNYVVSQVNANAAGLAGGNAFTGAQTIGGDTIVTVSAAQNLTNKTISATGNLSTTVALSAVDLAVSANITGFGSVGIGLNNSSVTDGYGAPTGTAFLGSTMVPLVITTGTITAERARFDLVGGFGLGATVIKGKQLTNPGNVTTFGALASSGLNIDNSSGVNNLSQIGFGYTAAGTLTNATAAIALVETSNAGNAMGDLVFGTRSVTTDTAPTIQLRIAANGLVTASSGLAVTGGTTTDTLSIALGAITSGTYSPTLTANTNVTTLSLNGTWKYSRVGSIVTVSGSMNVTATTNSGAFSFGFSLPVASVFSATNDCVGVTMNFANTPMSCQVTADTTNHRGNLNGISNSGVAQLVQVSAQYLVI